MSTQGPRVSKSVTKKITSVATYTFSHAELCKRLRIPAGAAITALAPCEEGRTPVEYKVDSVIAEVTTEATK